MHPGRQGGDRNQLRDVEQAGALLSRGWGAGEGLVCYDRGGGGGPPALQEAPACCWVTSPPVFWEQAIWRRGGGRL